MHKQSLFVDLLMQYNNFGDDLLIVFDGLPGGVSVFQHCPREESLQLRLKKSPLNEEGACWKYFWGEVLDKNQCLITYPSLI